MKIVCWYSLSLSHCYQNKCGSECFQDNYLKECLNVRQKLGTWKFFNVFLCFPMFPNVFQCYLLPFSLSLTISLFLTLTLFQSLIHSILTCSTTKLALSHSLTFDMLNNFCFHLYAQKSLSHSHSHTLSNSHTLSISHSLTLDMLNKFCFHL